jgi:hypothetical protein
MKKIITITLLMVISSIANADEIKPLEKVLKVKPYGYFSYDITSDVYHENYKEYDTNNNSLFMKETATLFGVKSKVSYQATTSDKFSLKTRYANGESNYMGAIQGNTYGSLTTHGQDRNVWELGAEYQHKFNELRDINVGVGINYRELTDRLDQAGEIGYKRVNSLSYANLSLDKDFQLNSWKMTPRLSVKALLNGKQKSYVDPELTLSHKQGSGHGYDVEVAFVKRISNHNLTISPYLKSMTIGNSEQVIITDGTTSAVTMEPKNKTTEAGLSLGLQF